MKLFVTLLLLCCSASTAFRAVGSMSQIAKHRLTTLRPSPATVEIEPEATTGLSQQKGNALPPQQLLPSEPMQLAEIRASIPSEAFERSLPKSLFYMFFDYAMWGSAFLAFFALTKSALWGTLPLALKAAATFLYSNVAGFFMWCIFVVGHDCGHTTFSKNTWLNNVLGHITHGSILVPFFPWQVGMHTR